MNLFSSSHTPECWQYFASKTRRPADLRNFSLQDHSQLDLCSFLNLSQVIPERAWTSLGWCWSDISTSKSGTSFQTDRSFTFCTWSQRFPCSSFYPFGKSFSFMVLKIIKIMVFSQFLTRNPAVNVSIIHVVIAVISAVQDFIRNLGELALFWLKLNAKVCSWEFSNIHSSSFSGMQVVWTCGDFR